MNSLDFLKQAQLADNLGYFRLADKLFNNASRVVLASAFDKALFEALGKAGIKAGSASEKAISKFFMESLEAALKGDSRELFLLLREAGYSDEAIGKIIADTRLSKVPSGGLAIEIVAKLEKNLNNSTSIFNRMKPSFSDKIKEVGSKGKDLYNNLMNKPNAKNLLAIAGIIAVAGGAGMYFIKANGEEASDEEVEAALNGADPYSNMYEDRMKAGQQQRQNEAAQKFVDENKSKYTSQRAFYDAALGAGDKNFANDVIAIVKKDTPELSREPTESEGKESSSYLNITPYS